MKESRLNYKATKKHDKYKGFEYDDPKSHHYNSKSRASQKNKEVRNIERAIRMKDMRALMENE
jgi:hypothetical protein